MRYRLFCRVLLGLLCVVGGSAQAATCVKNVTNYDECIICCGKGCPKQTTDSFGNTFGGGTGEACCLEQSEESACCGGTVMESGQFCCDGQISYDFCCGGKAVPENGGCCDGKVYDLRQKTCQNGKVV